MAKAVVTQDRVFEVADMLTARGEEPGILSVQASIGGGCERRSGTAHIRR